MTRKEKLEKLADLSLDMYIEAMEAGEIHPRDMASVISLLNQNNITEEKTSSSLEDEIKERVKEATERRKLADT